MYVTGTARIDASRQADENCLKAICLLNTERGGAYADGLAELLGISLSATYSETRRLVKQGYLSPLDPRRGGPKSKKQRLMLTPTGAEIASKLVKKHKQIQHWLECLGVPEEEADEEACYWEHSVTDKTVEAITRHVALATRIHSGDRSAMREMQEMVQSLGDKAGRTPDDAMIDLITRSGGVEGVRRKGRLSLRAGGDDRLEEILDLVESLGGMENIRRERDMYLDMQELARSHGGMDEVADAMTLYDSMGGAAKLTRLRAMADSLGGMDSMLNLLRREQKIWSAVLLKKEED